jgi:SAM-dependent methyltransferase
MTDVKEGLQFDKLAGIYTRVRPTYPARVYQKMLDALGVARAGVAVDVGCGSGQSVAGLLPIADRVIGIEPSDRLRSDAEAAYPRATFLRGTGESIPLDAGSADVITVANAFYWMEMRAALSEVDRVLRRPGVFSTYKYDFPKVHAAAADRVLRRHLAQHWDERRSRRLKDHDPTPDLMRECGYFSAVLTPVVPYTIQYTPAGFAEFMSSTSYVNAYLETISDRRGYLDRFAAELAHASEGEDLQVTLILFMNIGVKR